MKFFNKTAFFMVLLSVLLASGCASKKGFQLQDTQGKVDLVATEQYLPVQTYDEKNQLIPYQEKENPYLAQKAQVDKGSVLLFIEAKSAWRNEDADTAKQKLNVIIKNDAALSGPWMMLGDIALAEKDYPQALKHYQQGLTVNPNNINGYTALASVQRLQGRYDHAQNTLAKALALWPDFPEAHYNLSILFDIYLNQAAKAKQHLDAYILLTGGDAESLEWLQQLNERASAGQA
ncbi:MAG: tetratricopeptide repeat protein [Oleispira antarctica]|nr:tetratricopeptide repeat protein [Oleispira antarctica]MBQ0793083.1 tetratricopeptide repeat protein [Oleispira antarctica]